jgi:hypothetical protein
MHRVIMTAALAAGLVGAVAAHADSPPPVATTTPPTAASGAPRLVTATVRLDSGWRASKVIGAAVYDDSGHQIGTVDDLIVGGADRLSDAILSVGGFLGIGSKLVAIPFARLHYDPTASDPKLVLPGATRDSLNQMPGFTYNG